MTRHHPDGQREKTTVSFPFIVLGDRTDHGGEVIEASGVTDTHGKGIARMGDKVSCPKCRGIHSIAQGDLSMKIDGAYAAYHGCKTTCGAILISGQAVTTTTPSGGSGTGSSGSATGGQKAATAGVASAIADRFPGFGEIGGGLVAGYVDEPVEPENQRFKGRFRVLDATTGEPVMGLSSLLRSTGGQYINGATDEEGFTQWVERDASEQLAFDVKETGDA